MRKEVSSAEPAADKVAQKILVNIYHLKNILKYGTHETLKTNLQNVGFVLISVLTLVLC